MTISPGNPIRILVVDDSELVRLGLRLVLSSHSSVTIVGETDTKAGAIREAAALRPDVVLLDIQLPDGNGLDACREIVGQNPDTKVLVLSSFLDDALVAEAVSAGAHGYLLKDINSPGLVKALLDVANGRPILDATVTDRVLRMMRDGASKEKLQQRYARLSPQEQRVLELVAEGRTNKEVAAAMGLSEKTVKNYLSNLFEKLQISRRSQAAAFYAELKRATP